LAKNKKIETGIGGKKTSYEEDLKAAQNLVAEKQQIVDNGKKEAEQAEKTINTNKENVKALEEAKAIKKELLEIDTELTENDKQRLAAAEEIIALKSIEIDSSKSTG
jgi:hypothetical protein